MAASSKQTAAESAIARKLAAVTPNTPRHAALRAAHGFKASWVALGQALIAVQQGNFHKEWGYSQFAQYCRQELHIREETARKLIRSFAYLKEHAPSTLGQGAELASAPPLDVVDLLRQARSRTQIDGEAWQAVQAEALTHEAGPISRSQVLAKLRAADPSMFAAANDAIGAPAVAEADGPHAMGEPSQPSEVDPRHARKVLLLAERLGALLREQPGLAEEAHQDAIDKLTRSLRRHARIEAAAERGRA